MKVFCEHGVHFSIWPCLTHCALIPQTFSQREKRQQLEEKRKALKAARLSKVRQRKLQKLKEAGEEVTDDTLNLVDFGSDSAEKKGETG